MDENESKLKNILSKLSELDAAVQALPDFAVETPEPLETEPLETEPLETEPLASGGGFQYLHGDGIGEPFLTGARVRYECNSSGVVKAGHSVGSNITPGGFYYTIHLDNGMEVTALPTSIRAQVPRNTTRRDAPGLHDLGDGVYETDSTFQGSGLYHYLHGDGIGVPFLTGAHIRYECNSSGVVRVMHHDLNKTPGGFYYTIHLDDGMVVNALPESVRAQVPRNTTRRDAPGLHDLGDGVYETDSIFQKGGWITNSRMENLEWRVEALDSQFNEMNSKFIKILKILEDSIEKRHDLKKTTDVGDDTDDAPDHRDVSSALNDNKYNNLVQKLRRVADGPREASVLLKASPR